MATRVVLGLLAGVLLLIGLAAGVAAVWVAMVLGPDNGLRFDAGSITPAPDSGATIVDVDRFEATVPYLEPFGDVSLSVDSGDPADPSSTLFLGAGSTEGVDAYLRGVPYSVALRDGSDWVVREVPGVAVAPLPRQQDFWIAQDVGRRPTIAVPAERPLTLVIMHPSGIPSGPISVSVDFSVPDVATWTRSFAIACGGFLLVGGLLLVLALRPRRGRGRHVAGVPVDGEAP